MFKAPWRSAVRRTQAPPAPTAARVSVVVPLYNHARYVADAVRSALAQGPVLREVVVVDDGSTDGSAEALLAACGDEARLVLWSQPNRGAHAAIMSGRACPGGSTGGARQRGMSTPGSTARTRSTSTGNQVGGPTTAR